MSKDTLNALNAEALSRMTPYELVERAVALQTAELNTLDIDPIEMADGGVLHTVASLVVSGSEIRPEVSIDAGRMVHRQTMRNSAKLFASVVELRPPGIDSDNGDAKLYRMQESLALPLAEASAPFRPTALKIVNGEAGVRGLTPIRFDDVTNELYQSIPWKAEDAGVDYLSLAIVKSLPILGTHETQVQLQTVGKDELDKERGVLATVSGPAQVALGRRHFVRITDSDVYYAPAEEQIVDITLSTDTPQQQNREYYRIPDDATVDFDSEGQLVPEGARVQSDNYKRTILNPLLTPADALALVDPKNLEWTEGTEAFLRTIASSVASLIPLDVQGSYAGMRQQAEDKIMEMMTHRKPKVGDVGCLAVAARVSEMSLPFGGSQVNPAFFRSTR